MDSMDDDGQPAGPVTAGERLRSAREAAGLTRTDIASRTKIAERHLIAIEDNRFGDLAARTYAVGFARAYARALGLDETEIAGQVRNQLDSADGDRPAVLPSFEPGDPARVPPVRLAWIAGGGAVVVIVLLLAFWSSFLSPEGKLPDLLPENTPAPAVAQRPRGPAAAPVPASGPVVLTATEDGVWLAVSGADGKKLFERTMAKGESWTVPAGVQGAQLRTGRPDALQLTVGGRAIPRLSDKPATVSGVPLDAAALLARGTTPSPAPSATVPASTISPASGSTPSSAPSSAPRPTVTASARPAVQPTASRAAPPVPRPSSQPTSRPTRPPTRPPALSPAPAPTPAATTAPPPASAPASPTATASAPAQ